MVYESDTIFALSSAPGRAGVSVLRLSGPKAGDALRTMTGRALPAPRRAALRPIQNGAGDVIDHPLVLWFPAPKSFTGEDCVEIHVHGGVAIIEAVATELLRLGLRQARPGEFTRRAVEQGKMDLTEAEGLADLIDARSEGQRLQALQNMDGALREIYEGWQGQLLNALAQIEGEIDFADEADVPDALSHAAYPFLSASAAGMAETLSTASRGRAVRDGIQIAIIGVPNAGKSTLLNALVKRDVAITSPQAGTTRDIVEAQAVIAGLPVTFSDTAGLRETADAVEAEGVRRAIARAEGAHLIILVERPELDIGVAANTNYDLKFINFSNAYNDRVSDNNIIAGDALAQKGVAELLNRIENLILKRYAGLENAALTRARHVDCISRALSQIQSAVQKLGSDPELASEDIPAGTPRT